MQENPETKIELTNDKSLLTGSESIKQTSMEPQQDKKVSRIKNIIYITIIVLCAIGIVLFLKYQDKKAAVENIKIEDRTGDYCRASLYFFYEDAEYKYYFACTKDYYVIYDKKDYKLSEALEKGIINITALSDRNIVYYKETK